MPGYAGPGFIGTIAALRRIASARHPDRWGEIPAAEKAIWESLGVKLEGDLIEHALSVDLKKPRDPAFVHRIIDYREAAAEMRDALVSGRIRVAYRVDSGAIGPAVPAHSWASEMGIERLYRGKAWIDEGSEEVCRYLIIAEGDVDTLLEASAAIDPLPKAECEPRRRGARQKYDWPKIFDLLKVQVDKRGGLPRSDRPRSWQRDADGEHLLTDICGELGEEPGEATVRRKWTEFRKVYGAHKGS